MLTNTSALPTNFRYKNYLIVHTDNGVQITRCISISEAKRRNRKTRWPELKEYKFPQGVSIVQDYRQTPRHKEG